MNPPKTYRHLTLQPSSNHVIELLNYIEQHGGVLMHSSGHGKQKGEELKGTLIYSLGLSKGLMIALNKVFPSLYIKQYLASGENIFDVVSSAKNYLSDTYSISNKGLSSKGYNTHLDRFDWLKPSAKNPTILLSKVDVDSAKQIIDSIVNKKNLSSNVKINQINSSKKPDRLFSPDDLIKKLERQSEIGKQGECIAYQFEYQRLMDLGATPKQAIKAIHHVALDNVSKGYDIESNFNSERRCIEVKATTAKADSEFFFSLNEYEVLKNLGDEAFIYRVVFSNDPLKSDVKVIANPFGSRDKTQFEAIAFKTDLSDFI